MKNPARVIIPVISTAFAVSREEGINWDLKGWAMVDLVLMTQKWYALRPGG
jgi:hypothetical protein